MAARLAGYNLEYTGEFLQSTRMRKKVLAANQRPKAKKASE